VRRRSLIAVIVAMLLMGLWAAAAHADSLVYMKEGEVWISHGDGSDARQVTGATNFWSWPTEDDAGNILAAGGQGGINAGVEDTPGSEIYRFNQQGAELSAPQETPGSMSTVACPTYPPESLRVAPDGLHYAYHSFFCGEEIVQVGTVGGQGFTSSDYMSEFVFPYWVDNSSFVISRGGVGLLGSECERSTGLDCEWWTHEVGEEKNFGYPWFGDEASSATGFDGTAVSRDGTKFASVEDDAVEWGGAARNVELRIWSAAGAPGAANNGEVPMPTFKCQISLPPDPNTTIWYYNAGPTFSPDGTRLAFAEPDGVHIANVSNLDSCASVTAPLVIPGATQPFWSAADEAVDAGYQPPGGSRGGSGTAGGSVQIQTPAPDRKLPTIAALAVTPRRFAVAAGRSARASAARGATIHYSLSEPARVAFDVLRLSTGRRKGHRCVPATKGLRKAPHCVRTKTAGSWTAKSVSGANSLPFPGQLGRRKLKPGRYRLEGTPTDAAGNVGKPASAPFTVLRSGHRHRRH
jgi:hypothetical protein